MNDVPDLNLLLLFEALLRERSVTRAARALGIGQPAASNALARLRLLMQDELFIRSGADMLPTARAEQLAGPLRAALSMLRDAIANAAPFDPATTRRKFRISAGGYAAMLLVPPLVRILYCHAPHADLRVRFIEKSQIPALLDDAALDVALGVFPDAAKRFLLQPLLTEEFVCVMRADHPAAASALTPPIYAALPHALVTEMGDETGAVDDALRSLGLARRIAVTVPHIALIPRVLHDTDMIATIGRHALRTLPGAETLAERPTPLPLAPWQLSLLQSRKAATDPGLVWLTRQLAEIAGPLTEAAITAQTTRPVQ
jgi:DNA-binding transcriptional LysR family regulator